MPCRAASKFGRRSEWSARKLEPMLRSAARSFRATCHFGPDGAERRISWCNGGCWAAFSKMWDGSSTMSSGPLAPERCCRRLRHKREFSAWPNSWKSVSTCIRTRSQWYVGQAERMGCMLLQRVTVSGLSMSDQQSTAAMPMVVIALPGPKKAGPWLEKHP
jgi:hypothetical protein